IGSELTSLYNTYTQSGSYISDDIFQIVQTSVVISVQTQPGQYANALALLTTPDYGMEQVVGSAANNVISGIFPVENLLSLNELPDLLVSASPIYSALGNSGLVESQGDKALRSDISRDVFNVNGTGIKVGVLSDSYNTILGNPAADDVIKGDLPGVDNPDFPNPVEVLAEYPFGTRSDEGRAMLQIVHDVAPGADLAFRTGFLGPVDFAQGIHEMQQAGCDVIVDDVTYISEPFFRDGVVAQAVDSVTSLGVSYFTAAGNFGTHSWQGSFNPTAAPDGISGEANNFAADEGGVDIYQNISLYQGQYTVVLQWDDGTPGNTTNSDFDIYLANEDGTTLFGFNRNNTGGAPLEVLPFTVAADSAQSNFIIVRSSGTGPAQLKYIVYRGNLVINEYDSPGASTITGQANAEGANAVGAVLFSNTPEYSGSVPTIASFSSRGGTPVNGVFRYKPDFCAPNGVNTSVDLGGVNFDNDEFPNFFGTSAAAPHAAGMAALILQARQKFYGDTLSPALLKGIMQNTAYDMGTPGYDPASGAGFLLADSALKSLANPSPH
ncbi:MAG: S8 family serine peptidase, partial [Rhodanobacteraceae bacterium]